ncbi:hypothetical protein F5Y14DRAFT_332028 [Nemania sp. NC0429]|nr:hypothetical protein F5Y14DRAFT_332028 [Nemania sp. NC0429]
MMPSAYGANLPQFTPSPYISHPISDDFSRQQLAFSDSSRRMSRHPHGQRTSGAMRVVKPGSASNSPQTMMARRRTLMNDGNMARRRQQALDQAIREQLQDASHCAHHQDQIKRNSRPVSWHPSSHFLDAQQMHAPISQLDLNQLAMAMQTPYYPRECYTGYQNLPPTPAAYSGHASPISGYSPTLVPYGPATQTTTMPAYVSDPYMPAPQMVSNVFNPGGSPDVMRPFPAYTNPTSFDWHTYSPQEFPACLTPPTPNECQGVHLQQSVPPEESIPYQPLEESTSEEDGGEILVGMGLYDQPSKADTDPELDYYHTTTSRLLDTTYRSGKGWKLEEAWEPPASDDEDTEEDADGEDQEDEAGTTEPTPAQQSWI